MVRSTFGDDLIALYEYEQVIGEKIPVFVITKMDFVKMTGLKKQFEWEAFIILTEDDIENGVDTFALKFLHMKEHCKLIDGKNIFDGMMIDKSYLRHALETEIRNKLIQLREGYLSFEWNKKFLNLVLPVMGIIWEWVLFLHDKKIFAEPRKNQELVDVVCACNGACFQYIYDIKNPNREQVPQIVEKINEYLIVLRDYVDSYKVL